MKLHKQKVEVGHFKEQGNHSTSGMSYVDMMRLHSAPHQTKDGHHVPARPILDVLGFSLKGSLRGVIKKHFLQWGRADNTFNSRMLLLNGIGKDLREAEKSLFGIPSQFIPMNSEYTAKLKGVNSPMVETGELMDATAYKTSLIDIAITD